MSISNLQLGKQGLTDNFIQTLKGHFEKHNNVKIKVLKSAGHDKGKVKEISEEILKKLGSHYTARVIGFVIMVKRWRKARE
jgi:RNA-binding protein YhbY